jgi:uncharacterized damage-inducible protein DinB
MIRMMNAWNVNAWVVGRILDGFEGEDWRGRPSGANPAIWLLGHILMERKLLCRELGMDEPPVERDALFAPGTRPEDVPAEIGGEQLAAEFEALHGRLIGHLESMRAEDLEAPVETDYPEMPKTRLGALQFLFLHESYHVGQLGSLRVMLGKESWLANLKPPTG